MKPEVITLDFETYYDRDFGFSKMTTEEYVRDTRFEPLIVAIKYEDHPTRSYIQPEIQKTLANIDWSNKIVVCQNTIFDGSILKWHYGVNPLAWADTLGMSRALFPHETHHSLDAQSVRHMVGTKGSDTITALGMRYADLVHAGLVDSYAAYCRNDVDLTYALFQIYMGKGFPLKELKLIDLTIRMFIDARLRLDPDRLVSHLRDVKQQKEDLLATIRDEMLAAGDATFTAAAMGEGGVGAEQAIRDVLMSNEQFAKALRRYGVEPPMKVSPTTGKEAFAFAKTDEEFKALAEHEDVRVQALHAARVGVKTTLEETRTERFIGMAGRGAFPVPLRYYGGHTGRWSGQDKVNLQNLPARGAHRNKLKSAILPPKGHIIIDCDAAQIEARVLAWLAGQDDLVTAFERKEDVYKIMASRIYRVDLGAVTSMQRQVGKTVILGAGYGVGHVKLRTYLKALPEPVDVSEVEAKRIVDTYRATYYRIPELWKRADKALDALATGQSMQLDIPGLIHVVPGVGLSLPTGLHIYYPDLFLRDTTAGRQRGYVSKNAEIHIYGGKVVENCIAGGTPVLTTRGWVPIEQVGAGDMVHDGVGFVAHGGVVFKSVQPCGTTDGVYMTPDHEVLTNDGWQAASQNPAPYRPDLRHVDCAVSGIQRRKEAPLAVPLPVRGAVHQGGSGYHQGNEAGRDTELWLRHHAPYFRGKRATWDEQAPSICGVPLNDRPLSAPFTSGLGQLRRAWGYCMRRLGFGIPRVLAGYGANVPAWVGLGSQGQQRSVFPGELPLDFPAREHHEPAQDSTSSRRSVAEQGNWDRQIHSVLSNPDRVGSGGVAQSPVTEKPVYDIVDAGPRQRFVVLGASGPFVVHNCCQAVARAVIGEQMLRIARLYQPVLTVHDSIAIVAPVGEAVEAQAYLEACMSWGPAWADGLPLACESGMGASYGEC